MVGQVVAMAMACMAAAAGHEASADSVGTLSRELRQVSVTGRRVASQLASDRGVSVVGMGLMRSMPRILGNAAPLHYAQMLPGIQTGGEYDAGLHIQGSDNSHNMLAIDGVPIYNAAHLLGFFSVFNATHFSSMRIGKSATAAAAPNRLGGMVDMQAGRDRPPGPTGDVAVGPMSSQATVSLPAGRSSWLTLSARAAYFNLLYSRWLEVDGEELGYFFHDYNLTYTYAPDSRNRLWAEVYYGGDDASYGDGGYGMDTSLGWANFMAALHWDHSSGATGIGQCVYYTRYGSRLGLSQPSVGLSLESRIATAGYKAEARFGQASAGIDAAWHDVSPQEPRSDRATAGKVAGQGRQLAAEVALWGGWNCRLGRCLELDAGLRATLYSAGGKARFAADPTATLSWRVSPGARVSLSGGVRHQYLLRTGFSDVGLPTEFWFASGYGQSPQYGIGASLAAEVYLGRRAWRIEAEAYCKRLCHQVEYGGNVLDFVFDDYSLNDVLIAGDGHNVGLNLLVERRKGRLTGWVAYSFGLARRRFGRAGATGWCPAAHERPHELNAVATFKAGRRWSFGAAMVVASGTPYTRVERFYMLGNHVLSDYGPHNGERLPPYVRLDLSASYDFSVGRGRRSGINLSLYNVTAHDNVLFYRLKVNEVEYAYRPFAFALRLMPSVNYYFSF